MIVRSIFNYDYSVNSFLILPLAFFNQRKALSTMLLLIHSKKTFIERKWY